jgi:hypothetical protein
VTEISQSPSLCVPRFTVNLLRSRFPSEHYDALVKLGEQSSVKASRKRMSVLTTVMDVFSKKSNRLSSVQNVVIVNICLTIYSIQIVTRGYVTLNCVFTAVKTLQNNIVFGL